MEHSHVCAPVGHPGCAASAGLHAGKPRARIVLAEDHPAMAAQLCSIMEGVFEVVATVSDGTALVAAAAALAPDAIVTDIVMPGMTGLAAARAILQADPNARIVLVTVHTDAALAEQGLAAGALGYVVKLTAGDELIPAIQAALEGRTYVSPLLDSRLPGAGGTDDLTGGTSG